MIEENIRKEIKNVVKKYLPGSGYKFFIFGSRVSGEHRLFSDIDLGVLGRGKIPGHLKVRIEEDLENSNIPYKIDVVDFQSVSAQFRKVALKKTIYL